VPEVPPPIGRGEGSIGRGYVDIKWNVPIFVPIHVGGSVEGENS